MKNKILLISFLFTLISYAQRQTIFAYTDFNNFFQTFKNGYFTQIDHLAVRNVVLGDEVVAYYNAQGDFKIFDGTVSRLITNQAVEFKSSDYLAAWNLGPLLYYYKDGKPHNLTSFGANYWVTDSIITFQDTRYNSLNVVYKGQITTLVQSTTDLPEPVVQGDNILVFKDNGDVYKVFYQGAIYELGTYNGTDFQFFAGTDILAFNDPQTRTFAIFEHGEFFDVEEFLAPKVKAGRGFIAYEDLQGNLKCYRNGAVETLSSYAQFWDCKDDLAIWGDANSTYQRYKGTTSKLANYIVKKWALKNDVVAFETMMGGVSASVAGVVKEITTMTTTEFFINGHGVLVSLPNRSVIVLYNGQLYRN